MRISAERLIAESEATGFQPDFLEKTFQLLALLDAANSHPFLRGKLALKGGTALNLFVFNVPRLSVDVDLNYVGAEIREDMLADRPGIEEALQAVFLREDYAVRRAPGDSHAGGKWSLRYPTAFGQSGRIEVDLNYMYRVPLWPVTDVISRPLGSWQAVEFPVIDLYELAAGKLAALFARRTARDLFDCRLIFSMEGLDIEKLRVAFVLYGAMNRRDWRRVSVDDITFDPRDLARQLLPALHIDGAQELQAANYGGALVEECRAALSALLPFTSAERDFLDSLLDEGEVRPELLTDDVELQGRIRAQPLLAWKAQNVREYRGLS